jgi:hypothetical protein
MHDASDSSHGRLIKRFSQSTQKFMGQAKKAVERCKRSKAQGERTTEFGDVRSNSVNIFAKVGRTQLLNHVA